LQNHQTGTNDSPDESSPGGDFLHQGLKKLRRVSLRVQWHENVDLDLVSSEEHWPPAGLAIIPKSSCVALEIIWHNF
jgi:hypothetical protein